LREQIDVLNFTHDRMTPEGRILSRQLEYLYQVRVALICAPVPVCLLALGVAASSPGRRRPVVAGIVALGLYLPGLLTLSDATTASLKRFDAVPPHVYAWAPMLMIAGIGIWLIARHPPTDAPPAITEVR
jgi:Predicted permeases